MSLYASYLPISLLSIDIFSKGDASGFTRYYALYSSASQSNLVFYYISEGFPEQVEFPFRLADGVQHDVLLTASQSVVTLIVDSIVVGRGSLTGPIDDCGARTNDCILSVGQKMSSTGGALRFTGSMGSLLYYPSVSLTEFPTRK